MERSLVVLDDAAQHHAVARETAALVDPRGTVFLIPVEENVLAAIRRALSIERFDVLVLALSSLPDPAFGRDVARLFGLPVLSIPASWR
jgi:RNase P/RNase MRP subunit p30